MTLQNIEAERSRAGMSRTELSNKLNVTMKTYKGYIDGQTSIPSDKIVLLSKIFCCSTDYLLGLKDERR